MILSNNPKTYIIIGIYHRECRIIHKKYMYRWAGPSSAQISNLRLTIWNNSNIKYYKK